MTGLSRAAAAQTLADLFGTHAEHSGGGYDAYRVRDLQGKEWKIVRDSSITPQVRRRSNVSYAGDTYKVELNSPKLEYSEMEKLQEAVRALRRAGGLVNDSCGIENAQYWERRAVIEQQLIEKKALLMRRVFNKTVEKVLQRTKEINVRLPAGPPQTDFDEAAFTALVSRVKISSTAITFELINGMKLTEGRTEQ